MADLFDLPPVEAAPSRRTRPGVESTGTTPCPWRIAGARCGHAVPGCDPMRTCDACRTAGAPARVPWEMAKPKGSATSGEQVVVLVNAHLLYAPKDDLGSFDLPPAAPTPEPVIEEPVAIGTFPCGHPRYSPHGFCGRCNPARL